MAIEDGDGCLGGQQGALMSVLERVMNTRESDGGGGGGGGGGGWWWWAPFWWCSRGVGVAEWAWSEGVEPR